jgi:lipopolysaccharide transport system ATP-binding protein
MTTPAIRIEGIGKEYRLGAAMRTNSIREEMMTTARRAIGGLGDLIRGVERATTPRIWALRHVSAEIAPGEILGIIGRNGAGKSTLLKILSRITYPTEGQAKLRGRVGSLLEIGMGFHHELTGRENILLNGAIMGMRKTEIERKFDEIVAFAELDCFIDTPVKRYSSGMFMRLGFAVAAHLEPEILLVDEVLAVGDMAFQRKCLGKMRDVSHSGRTVLFVSHNMAAVESLCTRALLIDRGGVLYDGAPAEAVAHYMEISAVGDDDGLRNTARRQGSGEFRFRKIWMTTPSGEPISLLRSGQSIEIHALVAPAAAAEPIRANTYLEIFDSHHRRIASLRSLDKGLQHELAGPAVLTWHIEKLPLYEGEYNCHLWLDKWQGQDPYDFIPEGLTLRVAPGDFFSSGTHLAPQGDVFIMDFDLTQGPAS